MRDLSATNLTANQKSTNRPPLAKLQLTKTGQTTQTYTIDGSSNPLLNISHIEQEWSQIANVAVPSDSTLAALSLEGYTGTISWGYNDATNGDEYSACAPLEVMAGSTVTNLIKGNLVTSFNLAGVFDLMSADKASASYNQEDTDTNTVKDLLTAIAGATLACFSHCKAYTITFNSEDSLIDSYIPADYFYIAAGESRLSAFRKLIRTTKCKARVEYDGGSAKIHVYNPTISGATYDYEYNDAVTNHNFFEKGTRKRIVLPNYVTVSSHPDHVPPVYSGYATDADSYAAIGRYIKSQPYYIRATSNAQCTAIATAILQHIQVESERGHGFAPMNCGQEVIDYVKITDSVAGDTRIGNIGYIARRYNPGRQFSMEFRFGRLEAEMPFMQGAGQTEAFVTWEAWNQMVAYIDEKDNELLRFIIEREKVPKWHVYEQMIIPVK